MHTSLTYVNVLGNIGDMPKTLPMIDMSAPVCCAPVAAGPMSDDDVDPVGEPGEVVQSDVLVRAGEHDARQCPEVHVSSGTFAHRTLKVAGYSPHQGQAHGLATTIRDARKTEWIGRLRAAFSMVPPPRRHAVATLRIF